MRKNLVCVLDGYELYFLESYLEKNSEYLLLHHSLGYYHSPPYIEKQIRHRSYRICYKHLKAPGLQCLRLFPHKLRERLIPKEIHRTPGLIMVDSTLEYHGEDTVKFHFFHYK